MPQAKATFSVKSWDEKPYSELEDGEKFTRSSIEYTYQGDIEGESTLEYLMHYRNGVDGTAVGQERIAATIAGKKGAFVLQHIGTFSAKSVDEVLTILPNSGTGELKGIKGEGTIHLEGHQDAYPITLDYEFE